MEFARGKRLQFRVDFYDRKIPYAVSIRKAIAPQKQVR